MFFAVKHITEFQYTASISENVMEVRMTPRTEGRQRCVHFNLETRPRSVVNQHVDYLGNTVGYFNIPPPHDHLTITAESMVEILPLQTTLPAALPTDAWQKLDAMTAADSYWDDLKPSKFARPSPLLTDLIAELRVERRDDPLSLLRELNSALYSKFEYVPQSTRVDSPIDHALEIRRGVCQDFAHIMITLARGLRIPCRYVSGYLWQGGDNHDRSEEDATHAWVEALLPDLGWVGFDPTNDLLTDERHIRTAVGRDYADVPPTHGVYRGNAISELSVRVSVNQTEPPQLDDDTAPRTGWTPPDTFAQQQQQQQ